MAIITQAMNDYQSLLAVNECVSITISNSHYQSLPIPTSHEYLLCYYYSWLEHSNPFINRK